MTMAIITIAANKHKHTINKGLLTDNTLGSFSSFFLKHITYLTLIVLLANKHK